MKNFLFILAACLMVSLVNAAPAAQPRPQLNKKLQAAVQAAAQRHQGSVDLDKEDDFGNTPVFAAAQKGDAKAIASYIKSAKSGDFLLKTGKNGNNVFHVARNKDSFLALAYGIRHFYPREYQKHLHLLMNQCNAAGELPVQTQINYGRADMFFAEIPYTDLYKSIMNIKSKLSAGGIVADVAQTEAAEVVKMSKDNSGRTIAQAARDNASVPGMDKVVAFFNENASYL